MRENLRQKLFTNWAVVVDYSPLHPSVSCSGKRGITFTLLCIYKGCSNKKLELEILLPLSLASRYYSGKNNFHLSRHLSSHSLRVKEGKYASPLFEKVHCPHKLCSATKQLWTGPKKIRKCKSTRLSPENPAEDENCREHGVEAVQHLWRETSPEVSYSSSWLSSSISSSSTSPLSISLLSLTHETQGTYFSFSEARILSTC